MVNRYPSTLIDELNRLLAPHGQMIDGSVTDDVTDGIAADVSPFHVTRSGPRMHGAFGMLLHVGPRIRAEIETSHNGGKDFSIALSGDPKSDARLIFSKTRDLLQLRKGATANPAGRRLRSNPEVVIQHGGNTYTPGFDRELTTQFAALLRSAGLPPASRLGPEYDAVGPMSWSFNGVDLKSDDVYFSVDARSTGHSFDITVSYRGSRVEGRRRTDLADFLFSHGAAGLKALKEGAEAGLWYITSDREAVEEGASMKGVESVLLSLPLNRLDGPAVYASTERRTLNITDAELARIQEGMKSFIEAFKERLRAAGVEVAAEVNRMKANLDRLVERGPEPEAPAAPPAPKGPEYSVVLTYKGVVLEVVPVETQQEAIDAMTAMQGELRIKTVKGGSSKGAKANPYGRRARR